MGGIKNHCPGKGQCHGSLNWCESCGDNWRERVRAFISDAAEREDKEWVITVAVSVIKDALTKLEAKEAELAAAKEKIEDLEIELSNQSDEIDQMTEWGE